MDITVTLVDLWLPIVVSAVLVFFASALIWMVLPHHKADIKPLPDEQAWASRINELNLAPGVYMWPNCGHGKDMKSEEFKQRFNAGPWGSMTVVGNKPNFARNLVLVFVLYVVTSVFVAYLASNALDASAHYLGVFRIAGTAAIMAYCFGSLGTAIFFSKPLRFVITDFADGVVYGLLTAGVFGWLWPVVEVAIETPGLSISGP